MKIFVCCSARDDIKEEYLVTSANLLDKIFQDDNDLIFGADNTGVMKLAYNAAKKYQRLVYGVCPKNYIEDFKKIKCDKEIISSSAISRAVDALSLCDVVLILPGGIGTYSELFIALEAKRNHEFNKPIIIYNVTDYFTDLLNIIKNMYEKKFIVSGKEELFVVARSEEECLNLLSDMRN